MGGWVYTWLCRRCGGGWARATLADRVYLSASQQTVRVCGLGKHYSLMQPANSRHNPPALPQVHAHPEPFVRRAALLAAGQVLAQLPPAVLAGALLGAGAGSGGVGGGLAAAVSLGGGGRRAPGGGGGGGSHGPSATLLERLEWVAEWCRGVAAGDVDGHCRMMAQACVNLQVGEGAGEGDGGGAQGEGGKRNY